MVEATQSSVRSGNGQVRGGEAAGHNTCTQAASSLSLLTTIASSLLQLWDHSSILPGLAHHSGGGGLSSVCSLSSASENYADENLMAEGKT